VQLAQLIGNREIVIGLAGSRDAGVDGNVHDAFSVVPAPLLRLTGCWLRTEGRQGQASCAARNLDRLPFSALWSPCGEWALW
jgi:hypothetical protein